MDMVFIFKFKIKKLCGGHDTAESDSAVNLTPWSQTLCCKALRHQTSQYYAHLGVRLCGVMPIVESELNTLLML